MRDNSYSLLQGREISIQMSLPGDIPKPLRVGVRAQSSHPSSRKNRGKDYKSHKIDIMQSIDNLLIHEVSVRKYEVAANSTSMCRC
jgi:hypothetical protein